MKGLEKTKNELIFEHDRLCDVHDELLEKYKKGTKKGSLFDRKVSQLKMIIELKKIESRIDVMSDAIESVDAKMSLFKEIPKVSIDVSKSFKNISSSESVRKSLKSMRKIIDKEYKQLDILVSKKFLSHFYISERRKGLKKYDFGVSSFLGCMIGMGITIISSSFYQNMILPFVFMGLGVCIADIISVIKTKHKIKIFNKLNDELHNDKLDLICENGMQEVYDLSSKINKKCHDIMIMETIYKEQERTLEEAIDYESKSKFVNELKINPSYVQNSGIDSLTQESVPKLIRK